MLDITRHAVHELTGKYPSDSQIWTSIRNRDLTRSIREFLWRCLHKSYKCGEYWNNIPNYEHRAICRPCDTVESIEHILLECEAPGQKVIWELVQELWLKKYDEWPKLGLGTILGCGLSDFKGRQKKRLEGKNRLFMILISESAHLIWKIRCERVIARGNDPENPHSETEIRNRWLNCINTRLQLDKLLTDSVQYGNRALKADCQRQYSTNTQVDSTNGQQGQRSAVR